MHPLILHIETSTETCSVALSKGDRCLAVHENSEGRNHAVLLTVYVEEILKDQKIRVSDLDAVAVSSGPGSYTGLRIGVSSAKGICYGASIPLIAIPTLQAMCCGFRQQHPDVTPGSLLCPMTDARRMEVYTALFDLHGKQKADTIAAIITEQSFADQLNKGKIYFFGNGAEKCRNTIIHPNACFSDHAEISARYMIPLALQTYKEQHFESTAYFEPFYLKDFIAGKPKQI